MRQRAQEQLNRLTNTSFACLSLCVFVYLTQDAAQEQLSRLDNTSFACVSISVFVYLKYVAENSGATQTIVQKKEQTS